MKVIKVRSYEELSARTADILAAQVILKPDCVLGLATGSSPIGAYEELVRRYEAGELDFSRVRTVNLDEYCGLDGENDQSYRYFMNHHLFSKVNISMENTHVPSGKAADMTAECRRYDALLEAHGATDIQLLGIGHDGHIGFNEPDDCFPVGTHVVELEEGTVQANARFFDSIDDVPRQAITMGIRGIMTAKKVVLIASGEEKAAIIEKALYGPVTPSVPASILQLHPDVTVVLSGM